jgi:hypothetical protein
MKNLNVNAMGLQEMSHSEMVETDGGLPAVAVAAIVVAVAVAVAVVAKIDLTVQGVKVIDDGKFVL